MKHLLNIFLFSIILLILHACGSTTPFFKGEQTTTKSAYSENEIDAEH